MAERSSSRARYWLGLIAALLVPGVVIAWTNGAAVPRVIPFRGTLAVDGLPLSGIVPVSVSFYLTTQLAATTPGDWSESYAPNELTASEGQFVVNLGSKTPIPDALLANDPLYLGMVIDGKELNGKQRFFAAPHAINAVQAKDFTVAGSLGVTGNTTLSTFSANTGSVTSATITSATLTTATATTLATTNATVATGGTLKYANNAFGINTAGDVTAHSFAPQYDSGWVPVNNSTVHEVSFTHNFGKIPNQMMLYQCGALDGGGNCTTRVVIAGARGYQDGSAFINPVTLTADVNTIYVMITTSWWVWGYWNGTWTCGGVSCNSAYYRVVAWR